MSITDYMKDYQYCCTVSKSCKNNKILTDEAPINNEEPII